MDYISREEVIDCVLRQYCASSDETEKALGDAIEEIKKRPAADVVERNTLQHAQCVESVKNALDVPERNVGKWKQASDCGGVGYPVYTCSKCGMDNDYETNFCPNCGAKMEDNE